jgi:hypothetical protein
MHARAAGLLVEAFVLTPPSDAVDEPDRATTKGGSEGDAGADVRDRLAAVAE